MTVEYKPTPRRTQAAVNKRTPAVCCKGTPRPPSRTSAPHSQGPLGTTAAVQALGEPPTNTACPAPWCGNPAAAPMGGGQQHHAWRRTARTQAVMG